MKKPNETIEVFMSLIKWFFIVLLLNNAIWFGVVYSLVNDTTEEDLETIPSELSSLLGDDEIKLKKSN